MFTQIWIYTYAVPAFVAYSTRYYVNDTVSRAIHILLVAVSVVLSWFYITDFQWGLESPFVAITVVSIIVSVAILRTLIFVVSALVQQLCLLFAIALATPASYPLVVLIFSLMHPSWQVKVGSLLLGTAPAFLFVYFGTALLSISLHIVLLTYLIWWRKNSGLDVIHPVAK